MSFNESRNLAHRPAAVGVLVACVAALSAPAMASAAPVSLFSEQVKASGKYKVSMFAAKSGSGDAKNFAQISFSRGKPRSFQLHVVRGPATYSAKGDMSSARVRVRLGRRGAVSMRFRATEAARKQLPKGCKGRPTLARRGILTGRFKVRVSKRIKAVKRRIPAILSKPGDFTCDIKLPPFEASLTAFKLEDQLSLFYSRSRKGVSATVTYSEGAPGQAVTVTHAITNTQKGKGAFVNSGLSSARVRGFGPSLKGELKFTATDPNPTGTTALGSLSGRLVANFDTGRRIFMDSPNATLTVR